ncbi:hypothetical protein HDE_06224 [Halotydeus destructor]|nr:hypothetical protein HDE_06224 [Halotydeus destructor]
MSDTIQSDKWSFEFYQKVLRLICSLSPMANMISIAEAKLRQQRILFANLSLSETEVLEKKKAVGAEDKLVVGQLRSASNNTKSALLPSHEYLVLGRPLVFTQKFNSTELLDQPKLILNDCCTSDHGGALDSFIRGTMKTSIDSNKNYHPGCFIFGPRSCHSCETMGISSGDKKDYLNCPHSYSRLAAIEGKLKRFPLKGHLEMTELINDMEYDHRPLLIIHAKDLELLYFNHSFYKYQMQVCSLVMIDRVIVQRALEYIAGASTDTFETYFLAMENPAEVAGEIESNRKAFVAELESINQDGEDDGSASKKLKVDAIQQVNETADAE